ncbi:aldehyde ferredoxin oxidoreductase family protein [Desulfosoma caldarium]|uniref:Aldehyde:ferredoxin oxidoreductase n=1 Tax=Desulfosoma caldarium TaxID=610254 RepID=A0A3N1UQH2_9BACT|nr:aldehyde ferredoxin oxidoreductase family protein [Desulfosoma caldarium]ROQ90980.1 aldehyde:ferredoxin oxidoreductase [Desulfosoma caldarium]
MQGFFGRYLVVDVAARRSNVVPLDRESLRHTLGGKGLATQLLLEKNPAGVDPLSAENHLIFALGPASDTAIYGSCRHGIFAKSPLTGFYGESYSGGRAAIPMSRTGYDAIVLQGASSTPVWLEITDSTVQFHDASDLWGKDTFATEDAVLERCGVDGAAAVVIGPAGENLVRYAVVENDYWRSAGRCGMGAVLGSKKVKAVVFHGSKSRPVADPEGIKTYARRTVQDLKDHKATQAYRTHGTPMMVALLNTVGAFPTRYWAKGTFESWKKISAEILVDRWGARPKACRTCFMGCGKYVEIQEGRHKGLKIEGPEYETIYAFGGLCAIDALDEIAHLNDLCDRLGMDTITAGNMAAFAIEASRRGKIEERLEYGDVDAIARLLENIAKRQGLGDLLAEGVRPAAAALGLEDLAVHVKGMEPAGYDPRALKGMGLAYAVSDRGACHLRATFYKAELAGMIDPQQIEGKAQLFLDFEDRCTLFDCLILCRFYRDFYQWEELSKIIALTTGEEMEKADLQRLASRVVDSTRRFNLREGLTATDDRLPKRLLQEPLEDGRRLTEEELNRMVQDYYRLRGWSPEGVPSAL